jgi:rRNA maturation protein Rpf1
MKAKIKLSKYEYLAWHGSDEDINEFKSDFKEWFFAKEKKGNPNAIFFSKDKAPSNTIYGKRKYQKQFILTLKKPLIEDTKRGYSRDNESFKEIVERAIKNNYDGIIIKNVHDNFITDIYVVFNSNQIRLVKNQ